MDNKLLDLVSGDSKYTVYQGNSPLMTRGGRIVAHAEQRLLKQIITDFELQGMTGKERITIFKLLEFQIDYIDNGSDFITENFSLHTNSDEFILLKTGQAKNVSRTLSSPSDLSEEDSPIMNTLFWGASSVIAGLNKFIADNIQQIESAENTEHPFVMLLHQHYIHLKPEQRSAANLLCHMHGAGIVLPLLLILNRITASEYARGVISILRRVKTPVKQELSKGDTGFPYSVAIFRGDPPEKIYRDCLSDSCAVLDYLNYFSLSADTSPMVKELQKRGEGDELEYKSTLRWDLKAGKTNNAVERASLKTITGFLNSSGGILLIGIRDDGSVEGIESDRFVNEDKFLLHLWTLIRTSLGRDVSPYIQTILEKIDEKTVCIVRCSRSPRPVFLRQPGFNEEFYIRVGPSSNALDISEALRYIRLNYREA
jgi:hypothetical protein